MICYLDKTFCINPKCPNTTHEKLTDEIKAEAKEWMSDYAPIAVSDLCEVENGR